VRPPLSQALSTHYLASLRRVKRRKAQRKYVLRPATSCAPWAQGLKLSFGRALGDDALGSLALTFLTSAKEQSTYDAYMSELQHFMDFCDAENVSPLDVDVMDIVRFVAYVATLGTVSSHSMQPYLSAINRLLADNNREPIALGPLVNDAVNGFHGMQQALREEAPRVPLDADVAKEIHDDGVKLAAQAHVSDSELTALRDALATTTSFVWFNRSETTHSLKTSQLVAGTDADVALADERIWLVSDRRKGRKRLKHHQNKPIGIPLAALPELANAINRYKHLRAAAYGARKLPDQLWALPEDKPSSWTSSVQNKWLASALKRVNRRPPPGFTWTSHSLRSGPASAARAIGVTIERIKHFGGWSVGSTTLEKDYLDPTVQATAGAWFFFGWLRQLEQFNTPPADTAATVAAPQPGIAVASGDTRAGGSSPMAPAAAVRRSTRLRKPRQH
jgi:hypothetical protein